MAQRPSFDMTKLSSADKIIAGAAGLYFIWSFIPVWYSVDLGPLSGFGADVSISGWHGVTTFAVVLSILALVWVGLRMAGVSMSLSFKPGLVDLGLAAVAVLFTLLGLVVQPSFFGISWGLIVALLLAIAWGYGAYMKYNEPAVVPPPAVGGSTEPGPYNP
jgi:hypothetical protein